MKKILLITYHFPPDTAVGAVRPARFSKYLPEFGWEPVILTVKEKYYDAPNSSLAAPKNALPKIFRTAMFRNPSFYYRKIKRALHINWEHSGTRRFSSPAGNGNSEISVWRWINSLLVFPDEQAGWLPFAVLRGLHLIRREGVSVLVTSGPPHSVHLIGACLSKVTNVPWIADFRDPWLDSCLGPLEFQTSLSRKWGKWLEERFYSQASFVITTTKRFTELLISKFPEYEQKIATMPNGYDLEEFSGILRAKEKKFTISYLGSLYHNRNPEPVLCAIAELNKEKYIDPDRLRIRFIGDCNTVAMNRLIAQYGLNGVVEILPWTPRNQAIEIMVRSHVLLLLAEDQPLQIPGKIYEYLGSGSDILAITGEGATADLLYETGAGIVVSPGDNQTLKSAIRTLYSRYLSIAQGDASGAVVGIDPPVEYNRRHLTEQLAKLLESVSQTFNKK